MSILLVFVVLIALIITFVVRGFKIIQQSETMVIERLGRYQPESRIKRTH